MRRDAYSGSLKIYGEEHKDTLIDASNYAVSLRDLQRFKETKAILRKMMPVAQRVLGDRDRLTLKMRRNYAQAL